MSVSKNKMAPILKLIKPYPLLYAGYLIWHNPNNKNLFTFPMKNVTPKPFYLFENNLINLNLKILKI